MIADLSDGLVHDPVAAALVASTVRRAPVAAEGVPIIADLVHGDVDDAVAAALVAPTVGRAAVAIDVVAIVTSFSDGLVHDPVATALIAHAVGGAAVAVSGVTVVTDLGTLQIPVAALVMQTILWALLLALDARADTVTTARRRRIELQHPRSHE
jgi:hypothetical protein